MLKVKLFFQKLGEIVAQRHGLVIQGRKKRAGERLEDQPPKNHEAGPHIVLIGLHQIGPWRGQGDGLDHLLAVAQQF